MKKYQLKRAGKVLAEIRCEEIEMGKNQWLAMLKNKEGLLATVYLAMGIIVREAPPQPSEKSVRAKFLPR